MLSKVYSYGLTGIEAFPVSIEVDVIKGLPVTRIVGLPDNANKESKDRIRSAIKNSGFEYPPKRTTINLSPADIKKEGPYFDLAMALGFLAASGQIPAEQLEDFAILGELSLDGTVKPIRGALSVALAMRNSTLKGLILPFLNAPEAALGQKVKIFPVKSLSDAVHILSTHEQLQPFTLSGNKIQPVSCAYEVDFNEVKGQYYVKRALEIAASGMHNILLIGPPGSGKSMMAKRLPTILPDMEFEEALEVTQIYSALGLLKKETIQYLRPYRCPHHTTSDVAIVGGGSTPKPGEVTLANNGVLFLDEFPEFNRNVLEALRQPLEDHVVTIARANKTLRFPSRFMLVCAMNPCPCGRLMDPKKNCQCSSVQRQKYLSKISGPLLDRIDLHIEVPALESAHLLNNEFAESSQEIKERTTQTRHVQLKRFENSPTLANAYMAKWQIKTFCRLSEDSKDLLRRAIEELDLSARAYDKILKVARTIADMTKCEDITPEHIAEAIQYRSLDRGWWG